MKHPGTWRPLHHMGTPSATPVTPTRGTTAGGDSRGAATAGRGQFGRFKDAAITVTSTPQQVDASTWEGPQPRSRSPRGAPARANPKRQAGVRGSSAPAGEQDAVDGDAAPSHPAVTATFGTSARQQGDDASGGYAAARISFRPRGATRSQWAQSAHARGGMDAVVEALVDRMIGLIDHCESGAAGERSVLRSVSRDRATVLHMAMLEPLRPRKLSDVVDDLTRLWSARMQQRRCHAPQAQALCLILAPLVLGLFAPRTVDQCARATGRLNLLARGGIPGSGLDDPPPRRRRA